MSPNDGSSKCRNYEAFRDVVLWCTGVRARLPFGGAAALRRPSSWLSVHLGAPPAVIVQGLELFVAKVFGCRVFIFRALHRQNQLGEFELDGQSIPVLGVLDEEDHQKGDDGRAGIDHELPSVAEVEKRAGNDLDDDNGDRQEKCDGIASPY